VSGLDKLCQVTFRSVIRDAAHGHSVVLTLVPCGECDLQHLGGHDCVVHEHLVKIAHPEKEDGVRVFPLDGQVLLHHGGAGPASCFGSGLFHRFMTSASTSRLFLMLSESIIASTESVRGPYSRYVSPRFLISLTWISVLTIPSALKFPLIGPATT